MYKILRPNRTRPTFQPSAESLESRRLLAGDIMLAKEKVFHDPSEPLAIVGGTEVKNDDYPWMVSLQTGDEHFCGGSLIAADAVLTAAHCVVGESPEAITAVVNRNDLNSNSGEELSASQIFVHSDYDDFSLDSDIAVVLLSESSLVQPASIVRAEQLNLTAPGAEAVAIGWGSTSEFGGIISNLREVGLPIVSNEVANQPESYDGTVTDRMIAAGFAEGGKDTCGGDSGGPLFVQNQGEIYVAGITSWGDGCAQPNLYGISTRVSDFTDWIDSQVLVTSAGNVNFSQERYGELGIATVSLTDADLSGQGTAIVELRSDRGDVESLELIEAGTGRFLGSIGLSNSEVAAQNGALEVEGASNIQVVYQDANDGNGVAVESSDAARIVMDDFANGVDGAHELDLPGLVSGEIELSGDVDWFQFTAVEGQAYEITVDLNGSLSDSTLAVYDSDGETLLAFNDDTEFGLDSRIIVFGAESGTKYVEVAGFGSTVGTYSVDIKTIELGPDDHGNNAQNATAVSIGSITRGAIGFNSDVDWFSVNVVEGEKYVFDVSLDGLNDSVLRLIDSDGVTELAFNDDTNFSTASQITWTATEDEVVYVEVSAFSSGNGRYNLEILQINDDHGDDAASATVVESPSATAGRIEFGDDVDWFAIDVVEGQLYEFEVLLDGLEDSFLRLLNSDGEILAFNDDHAGELSSQINWLSTASETLFVEVSAFSGFGDYDFVVSTLEIPDDDHGNDATTATPIGANTSTSGNIEFNADVDWFSIEVIAGQVYEIDVALQSLNDSFMRLFDSDGETLFASNDDTEFDLGSRIVWFADSSRTLYVEVSSYLASGNGEYQLEVLSEEFLDDDHGNFGSNATPIELPSTTVGTIDNAIDVDWFSFNATEGQEIQFDVVLNQLPDSILRLIDSDGITQLEFNDDSEGFASQIVWLAPRTDQFFLEVFGFADATGSYQLETEVIRINQDDHGNDAENATLIEAGSITNGNIDFDFDVDWFALNIVEGKYYEIEVFLDSQPDSIVSLFDADGQTLLAVNDDGGINLGSLIVWDASMSGEVFIEVAPFSFETGSYRLGVTEIEPPEDDHGNDAAGATTVSTSTTSGIVNYATDADWFAIELIEGVEYEFTVELNGLFDSVLALYAADGETLIEINDDASEDSLASYLAWQATATEVVYLEVRGFAADTGAYSLVVSQSDDHGDDSSVATVVSLFSPISGVLEADSDIDWFAFNATGGTAYQITTDIAPAPVTLYSMDGTTEIDSQETAAFDGILWLAPEDGTYFVSVGSPGLPDAQDYELSISIPYGDANLDGRFNSADLTLVWQSGEYRDAAEDNSEWHEGDWNGDGEFGTRDIVEAMILATYELDGARNAADRQQRRLSPKDDSIEIDDQELNRVAVAVLFDRLSEDQFQFAS